MPRSIPESCAHLDLEGVGLELIRTSGNVSAAARALSVPTHDLRLLTYAVPALMEAALEAEERALDEAEAMVLEAVRRAPDMRRRIRAAGFYLRASAGGRRRGFR